MALTLDGDNGISGINGSATTPAVQGTDTNTGLTFGTDTVGVVTGGSTRATFDSSGRLGIGVTDPAEELEVSGSGGSRIALNRSGNDGYAYIGTGTTNDLHFGYDGSGSSEYGRFDSSGRLLVGATSSEAINGDQTKIQIKGTNSSAGLSIHRSQNSNSPAFINLAMSRSGAVVSNNDPLGAIYFVGHDGTDLGSRAASIQAEVDGSPSSNDMPGRLIFSTTNDTYSSPVERMRIKKDGRIVAGNGYTISYGQIFTAVKTNDDGRYFGIGDDGNSANAWSRDSGTTTYTHIQFANGNGNNGNITTNGTTTAYNTSSDYRLKENVVDLDGAIDRVKQLAPKRFNFIVDADTTVDGFLAHETQTVVPEAVTGTHNEVEVWKEGQELPDGVSVGDNKLDEDGNTIPVYQGIDQSKLVPLLTAALQEAIGKIEALETRVAQLEGGAA